VEADKNIHSQLRLTNFCEGSPYETIHSFVSKWMSPYFKSYVKESGRADRYSTILLASYESERNITCNSNTIVSHNTKIAAYVSVGDVPSLTAVDELFYCGVFLWGGDITKKCISYFKRWSIGN